MRVRNWLNQTVAREGLLVGVSGFQALITVGHFTSDTGLHRIPGRILVTELAQHFLGGGHGVGFKGALSAGLAGGIGAAHGGLLEPVDDVLQSDVAFEPV